MEPIDLVRLRNELLDDDDFLFDVLNTFAVELERGGLEFRDAVAEERFGDIRHIAHRLKGSFRTFGLSSAAERLENLENAPFSLDSEIQDLRIQLEKVMQDLVQAYGVASAAIARLCH